MDPFLDKQQIDEMIPFDWDDEETKFDVEDYDDASFESLLASGNDF